MRAALLLLLLMPALALAALPQAASVPGGVAIIALGAVTDNNKPQASFAGHPVLVVAERKVWYAVVGLPLDTHVGEQRLNVRAAGSESVQRFQVTAKKYPEQHITLQDKGKVELVPQDEARAAREIAEIKQLKLHWRDAKEVDLAFVMPANGELSSRFGLRRFFNGQPRLPHAGLDLAVPRGTPVLAVSSGQVLAAADYFFNGNTVFIDHGDGLITMYCHLDRIDVKAGETVSKGQQIALSGMTGRATGPHLHWSVILNGAMVDPALFVTSSQPH